MPASPRLDALTALATAPAQAMACKLLFDRNLYTPCHIRVPDSDQRLAAVYVHDQFYSFFRLIPNARKALEVLTRLGKRDNSAAITHTPRGYVIWVHEAGAYYAPPARRPSYDIRPVFGPTVCWVVDDPAAYRPCRLQVADMAEPLNALAYGDRYYSIFKQEADASKILEVAAKLARRGDETLIVVEPTAVTLALLETNGQLM